MDFVHWEDERDKDLQHLEKIEREKEREKEGEKEGEKIEKERQISHQIIPSPNLLHPLKPITLRDPLNPLNSHKTVVTLDTLAPQTLASQSLVPLTQDPPTLASPSSDYYVWPDFILEMLIKPREWASWRKRVERAALSNKEQGFKSRARKPILNNISITESNDSNGSDNNIDIGSHSNSGGNGGSNSGSKSGSNSGSTRVSVIENSSSDSSSNSVNHTIISPIEDKTNPLESNPPIPILTLDDKSRKRPIEGSELEVITKVAKKMVTPATRRSTYFDALCEDYLKLVAEEDALL
jgi:hypothetical protein